MIKIALKHWIYEKCIDVLFEGICRNFAYLRKDVTPLTTWTDNELPFWMNYTYHEGLEYVPHSIEFMSLHCALMDHAKYEKYDGTPETYYLGELMRLARDLNYLLKEYTPHRTLHLKHD